MKFYSCIVDNGDGSNTTHYFKTKEDANAWIDDQDDSDDGFDCYPYGPLEEEDTDSKFFWSWPDPWGTK